MSFLLQTVKFVPLLDAPVNVFDIYVETSVDVKHTQLFLCGKHYLMRILFDTKIANITQRILVLNGSEITINEL